MEVGRSALKMLADKPREPLGRRTCRGEDNIRRGLK